MLRRIARLAIAKLVSLETQSEASHQTFRRHNERPVEYAWVFRAIGRCAPKRVLDVGTGTTPLPAMMATCGCVVMATDNVKDYWPKGMTNRHWHVQDDDIQTSRLDPESFDLVTCISTLEHIADHRSAMRNMLRSLKPGGHLVLTCPYTAGRFTEDCYRVAGVNPKSRENPYPCRSYSRAELDGWLADSNASLIDAEYWKGFTGEHWAIGDRIAPPLPSSEFADHNLGLFLVRKVG